MKDYSMKLALSLGEHRGSADIGYKARYLGAAGQDRFAVSQLKHEAKHESIKLEWRWK